MSSGYKIADIFISHIAIYQGIDNVQNGFVCNKFLRA